MSCGDVFEITNGLHKVELMNMCRNFSISETFTDVQLIAKGGKKVYAHKLVLVAVSGLLKTILENRPDDPGLTTIHVPDISYITLRLVINFLYMGSMRLVGSQKAEICEALKLLEIDIHPFENEDGSSTTQTTPAAVNNEIHCSGASAAQSAGPVVVNSFSQNPMAFSQNPMPLLTVMENAGNQALANKNSSTASGASSSGQELMPAGTTVGSNQTSCSNQISYLGSPQASCCNHGSCSNQTSSLNHASRLNRASCGNQLLQLLPIAGGGGLVAIANLGVGYSGAQLQQANGQLQLVTTNGGNTATPGLRLVTSTPQHTPVPAAVPSRAVSTASDTIDLSTDDDGVPPPTASTSASAASTSAVASSPNRPGRRKRTQSPDASSILAKRLAEASPSSCKDIIDLD